MPRMSPPERVLGWDDTRTGRHPPRIGRPAVPSQPFKPGDRVVWWKQTPGGGYVAPVFATVLAVTARRVKIEAEDEEGKVVRHVLPRSIGHHAPAPKAARKPPKKPAPGRGKRSGQLVVWPGRTSTPA